jgi:hypothetical protein
MYHYKTGAFIPEEERLQLLKQWPHVNEGQAFWAFEEPPADSKLSPGKLARCQSIYKLSVNRQRKMND